jgi:hypothetical protein
MWKSVRSDGALPSAGLNVVFRIPAGIPPQKLDASIHRGGPAKGPIRVRAWVTYDSALGITAQITAKIRAHPLRADAGFPALVKWPTPAAAEKARERRHERDRPGLSRRDSENARDPELGAGIAADGPQWSGPEPAAPAALRRRSDSCGRRRAGPGRTGPATPGRGLCQPRCCASAEQKMRISSVLSRGLDREWRERLGHACVRCQLGVNAERACALEAEKDGEMLPAALAVPAGTEVSESMWDSWIWPTSGVRRMRLQGAPFVAIVMTTIVD